MNGDELNSLICEVRSSIYKLECAAIFLRNESLRSLVVSDTQRQLEKIQQIVDYLRPNLASLQEEIIRRKNIVASLENRLSSVEEEE
ncbi:hypothetical protein A0J48_006920 [Sphaerospermopsis aphanizomenoides BCCUSP55]|uniref:hypothetical protein n=1 Tax=Sphaerospermopsis aphanizomenoides TaxID=459663 RepID=UPI001903DF67|nr:hypothetical protein [Sphaerospermopsis aphanizomenoides]MBK1987268.1 hypothetical protein [Sphaerospermopsis aphanizomenoides BCCUSP55]